MMEKPKAGVVRFTGGHPVTGKRQVTIDLGDGTHLELDWAGWEEWQSERLRELGVRMDVLRDFESRGPEH